MRIEALRQSLEGQITGLRERGDRLAGELAMITERAGGLRHDLDDLKRRAEALAASFGELADLPAEMRRLETETLKPLSQAVTALKEQEGTRARRWKDIAAIGGIVGFILMVAGGLTGLWMSWHG